MSEFISLGPKHPFIYGNYGFDMATDVKTEVRMNLRNILLTNPGEWPGEPDLGVGITQVLFDNRNNDNYEALRSKISSQVAKYLPIIYINSINVYPSSNDKNLVNFSMSYSIPDVDVEDTVSLLLDN